ncbi:MAG: NAD(P)H-hydrate dehydratase [Labilithrix sp.]|nr:NAD(P)H-hydrate dehydratase [Labilithrix sp.]MCW5812890.1 NAD(P)H-hydrate dehydratase [Labilithrix sp.]
MIPVLSRDQMRAFDKHAIEACGVPSLLLMENAGRGAADVIEREALGGRAAGARVIVVAGTGNNGGDGFVVARHLLARGANVEVWLAGDARKQTPDCKANHEAWAGIGGVTKTLPLGGDSASRGDAALVRARPRGARSAKVLGPAGPGEVTFDALGPALAAADVVVDALFGTGLDRAIAGPLAKLALVLVALHDGGRGVRVAALDVPSGLHADTGVPLGPCIEADLTVTFAHLKLGLVTGSGAAKAGTVHVVDIGVPPSLVDARAASLVESSDVRALLAKRAVDTHKYRAGHVALFAGSPGKTGAALLAAQGALRGGAGAATIVSSAADVLEACIPEVMVARLDAKKLAPVLAKKAAALIGPGFGTDAGARAVASSVLKSFEGPIVADADAFTLFAGKPSAFAVAKTTPILTPHSGELGRLLGVEASSIDANRFAAARDAAKQTRAVVLLKGAYTVVAAPDGRVVVSGSGSPSLATAGAGDVLAGLITALACSLPPFEAAWAGAFLHGVAGAAWSKERGDRGMLAGEIAGELPGVIAALLAS